MASTFERLKPIEISILESTARGLTMKEIASELHFSRAHIVNTRNRLLKTFNCKNSCQLIAMFVSYTANKKNYRWDL